MREPVWIEVSDDNGQLISLGLKPVDLWTQVHFLEPLLTYLKALIAAVEQHSSSEVIASVDPKFSQIAQDILNLHELVNCPGKKGIEVRKIPDDQFYYLFMDWSKGKHQEPHIGALEKAYLYQPIDIFGGETNDFPPFSSGDRICDRVANFICSTGVKDALALMQNFQAQEIDLIMARAYDINRGPKAREKEAAIKTYERYMGSISEEAANEIFSFSS